MAITLTVEDGTGLEAANSYLSVADADAYHEANVHSADWPSEEEDKQKALITATRILDQQWIWYGFKLTADQALQWPRGEVPDPDRSGGRDYIPSDEVPQFIKNATAELARVIYNTNLEASSDGEGLRSFGLVGVMNVEFDLSTRPDFVPDWISTELRKYGQRAGSTGGRTSKLTRV